MGFAPKSLGSRDAVIARLCKDLPTIEFSDPTWGTLDAGNYSILFDLGESMEVDTVTLHVEGDATALQAVQVAAQAIGSRAVDLTRGQLLA
ncbi:MAG TPA: hypothetical protein VK447_16640 [Myxococcaceae bacterium]|nr:hypothetical protein [Myxococcaceae bacterium]